MQAWVGQARENGSNWQALLQFNSGSSGGTMSHSLTVTTRRRKKRAEKDRAVAARLAKKQKKQNAKPAGAH
jgi:hypothetical protein